jgi:RNA recognition motif-containing protein
MRRTLYELCSEYGTVIDVVATKVPAMRGQAFVVFRDAVSAGAALQGLDGRVVYTKPMRAQYARKPSNALYSSR